MVPANKQFNCEIPLVDQLNLTNISRFPQPIYGLNTAPQI